MTVNTGQERIEGTFADLDAVSRLLQPPCDTRFDDRFTQRWNNDIRHDQRFDPVRLRTDFERTVEPAMASLSNPKASSTSLRWLI